MTRTVTPLVELEDRNPDGRGRGFLDGRAVLVSQGLPGERVEVLVDRETRGTLQGRVANLVDATERRIETACSHTFVCTGCPMLGEDPASEAAFKEEAIASTLASVDGGLRERFEGVTRPSDLFGYRHYAKQVFERSLGKTVLGSYVAGTHEVVSNRDCPILAPALALAMSAVESVVEEHDVAIASAEAAGLKHTVARLSQATGQILMTWVVTGELSDPQQGAIERAAGALIEETGTVVGVSLVVNESGGNVILRGKLSSLAGSSVVVESMCGYDHRVGPLSFFQINPVSASALFACALKAAGEGGTCLELFSGVGVLTLPLADKFERVVAVEVVEEAARSLELRLCDEGREGVVSRCGDAADVARDVLASESVDVIVADPPRRGLGEELCELMGGSLVKRVVLLSCDATTLAKDLPHLMEAGLRVTSVWGIDQFPRTAHVETVTLLERV